MWTYFKAMPNSWHMDITAIPTPITDAAVDDSALENKNHPHTDWVSAYTCRRLERERAVLRQVLMGILLRGIGVPEDLAKQIKEALTLTAPTES
jgi:hypothetical protein